MGQYMEDENGGMAGQHWTYPQADGYSGGVPLERRVHADRRNPKGKNIMARNRYWNGRELVEMPRRRMQQRRVCGLSITRGNGLLGPGTATNAPKPDPIQITAVCHDAPGAIVRIHCPTCKRTDFVLSIYALPPHNASYWAWEGCVEVPRHNGAQFMRGRAMEAVNTFRIEPL
jgi:hypothetical protein